MGSYVPQQPNLDESFAHRMPVGKSTMSPAMSDMRAYPNYLLSNVRSHLGNRVWEIGVGNGQTAKTLLMQGCKVLGTDISQECLDQLVDEVERTMPAHAANLSIAWIDLQAPESIVARRDFQADSVVCFNVLEHIADDRAALDALRRAVAPSATLGLIVPAHPALFGRMDQEAGHHRRYTRASVTAALTDAGWSVITCRYINALGAVGWWFHNRVRRDAGLTDNRVNAQMRYADRWLPRFARCTDWLSSRCFGLSVVSIARPKSEGG